MENKNNETIHIKVDEEIISIVNKLRQCEENEITLLVPSDALLLQSVVNLKILKKKAGELKKNISIITIDEDSEDSKRVEDDQILETENKTVDSESDSVGEQAKEKKVFLDNNDERESNSDSEFSSDSENNQNKSDENTNTKEKVMEKKKVKMFDIVRKINKASDEKREEEVDDVESEDTGKADYKEEVAAVKSKLDEKQPGRQSEIKINEDKSFDASKSQKGIVSGSKKTKKRISLLPSISSKVFAIFMLVCIATTALIAFFVFRKVDIDIALKAQETNYNFEFVTDEAINEIDAVHNKIPVERIEVVSEKTETYSTMGKKRVTEKAKGEITVYNEYSSNSQKIVVNTRFLSKEGQLFKIAESITIPGFSRVEGKDVPGEVTATVYADVAGEEYNIGASSFTLPGLQGHPKYASVYARSTKAMSGGIDKDVLYFSESDYITAKDKLVKIAEEESEQDFLGKISDQVILLENTKERSDTEVKTDIKIGDTADNFQMTVLVKTSALVVNKNNLNNLIGMKINSELGENMELVEGSRNYEVGETVKNENGSIAMPIQVTQDLITKVDEDKIRKEIAGKGEPELNNYFNNIREIESVNVEFWPKWVKSVPASWDKINIEIGE